MKFIEGPHFLWDLGFLILVFGNQNLLFIIQS